jgi:hypothetical protein
MKTLTLNREGHFTIMASGPNHCGSRPDGSYVTINYHLLVECEASLDSRGFLFDQLSVRDYFDSLKTTSLSCEKLVMRCARDIVRMILGENPDCELRSVHLSLKPEPYEASVSYFIRDKELDDLCKSIRRK